MQLGASFAQLGDAEAQLTAVLVEIMQLKISFAQLGDSRAQLNQ